jgi:hypothetical protein
MRCAIIGYRDYFKFISANLDQFEWPVMKQSAPKTMSDLCGNPHAHGKREQSEKQKTPTAKT